MSAPLLPPDAPFTPEELAEAEALRDALHSASADSEEAALLHDLRALHTDADLSAAEHEALVATALEQAGAGAAEPAKPVLRLLRRVSYAVVPTLAAAATVMFVIRGREAQAPASAAMSESAASPAASTPALEAKTALAAEDLAAKREASEKATARDKEIGRLDPGFPYPDDHSPWEKTARGDYAAPPPASIDDAVPGGGALGTGKASGGGARAPAGHAHSEVYAEAPRAGAGAVADRSRKGTATADGFEFKDAPAGDFSGGAPEDRVAASEKKAADAKMGVSVPAAPAAQAAAPAPAVAARKPAARAAAAPISEGDRAREASAENAGPAKSPPSPTCTARCTELLEARKRLETSCTQPKADAKVCADQRAWLAQQFEQQLRACGVCK